MSSYYIGILSRLCLQQQKLQRDPVLHPQMLLLLVR